MDLTGKLIIKVSLGDDIRRIPIHNEDITYDELILMMQRVFRDQLDASADITLKYKDEDGDLITLFDSADLAAAISYSRVLKLTLFVDGKIVSGTGFQCQDDIIGELRNIRDRINQVLDKVGDQAKKSMKINGAIQQPFNEDLEMLENKSAGISGIKLESKEFDPLQKNQAYPPSVAEDQQSVSSQTSSARNEQPTPVSSTPAAVSMPSHQQAAAAAGMTMAPQQTPMRMTMTPPTQYPGYPPAYSAPTTGAYPMPEAAKNGPQQMYPGYQMPSQQPGTPQQMSAFIGYQQPQSSAPQAPISSTAPSSATTGPAPSIYPPQRPGMPTGNPYGMAGGGQQRGPTATPHFARYPQAPGYQ